MRLNYFKLLDKVGNDMGICPVHLSRSSMVENAISTGSLTADLIIGGGWPAGRWVALFGPEASCKSTLLYHTIGDSIVQDVNAEFLDFEGSTDPSYLKKILSNIDVNRLFGLRKDTGVWEITPQCRYHQPDLGEPYFRYIHRILKVLPDKLQNANQWYYVYDKKPKDAFDQKLYKNTGRFWVPADDGSLQVIWFIDSLPAMLTEKQDESDESKEIGLQARMFSKNIPLIKSRLARKRCSVVAVNQIRLKPMAFGNPEYEPGGEAPKFYCFSGNTYLQTDKGLITALEAYLDKPNKILGESFLESPNIYSYMGQSDVVKITTEHGFELTAKPGHAVLALDNRTVLDWTVLADLRKTHYVALKTASGIWPLNVPKLDFSFRRAKQDYSSNNIDLPQVLSKELARLLGYLTSEGYCKAEGGSYKITFTKADPVVMEDFCRLFRYLFPGIGYSVRDVQHTRVFEVCNCQVFQFLKYLGCADKPAREKTVPWCIRQSPEEHVIEFLIGYFTGDISIEHQQASIASASREMLKQVQLLLLNMGIVCKREEYRSNWFSPLDERSKYANLTFYGENLVRLVSKIGLISKKGEVESTGKFSYLYERLPILQYWLDTLLFCDWVKKYGVQNGKHFCRKDITTQALEELQQAVDRKVSVDKKYRSQQILETIKKLVEYADEGIYFDKVQAIEYCSERMHTFDANMPNHTVLTDGIISHNSDIRLQCRSCSNPFGKGQIEEEPCWDGIGVDKYRYIKICTRKNKCFSPFRESLMRIWMEEKGDTGRGLDPVFDTFQYLKETGQVFEEGRGTKKVLRLLIPGMWTQRAWTYKEFKELVLNPNRVDVYVKFRLNDPKVGTVENSADPEIQAICTALLDLRAACKRQLKDNTAFDLYFKTICNGGNAPEPPKTCGMCAHFRKLENCMEVKESQDGCEDWLSEQQEEEEALGEEAEA